MPAEAIHLSALDDSLRAAPAEVLRATADNELRHAARLGAIFVDLPYFDRFPLSVARYLLGRPPAPSAWGDINHRRAPMAVGRELAEAAARLRGAPATRSAGESVLALSLGYISHAAVDTALHPLINRLAAERALALSDSPTRQHQEVEKFQSILFHHERFGFDFMGTQALRRHIHIEAGAILDDRATEQAVWSALYRALGSVPAAGLPARWARGYQSYVALIAGPAGKRVAPEPAKERERPAVFAGVDFPGRYLQAVRRSTRWLAVLWAYADAGDFSPAARAALHHEIPEQTLDPGPEAAPPGK